MIVLDLSEVLNKLIDLFLTQLKAVFELLIHELSEFELVGGTEVSEGGFLVVKKGFFRKN